MAETVHLHLKSNGADVKGESSQTSLGREGSIECLYLEDAVRTARERGSGMASGRRTFEPMILKKRIDKSSPLLAKSLCNNEVIEGKFLFFRPNPTGDGTTQQFFTIEIAGGRLSGIKRVSPNTIDPAAALEPPTEEVAMVFHTITWTFVDGGITHTDTWDAQT